MEYPITRKLSLAYWPNPSLNESANREQGDATVDKLTIGELAQFFAEIQAGPTYCMVARRVAELLKKFPPHIEDKRARASAALEEARLAVIALSNIDLFRE